MAVDADISQCYMVPTGLPSQSMYPDKAPFPQSQTYADPRPYDKLRIREVRGISLQSLLAGRLNNQA
ncbi:hypothetical protein I79_017154 [Cricetulus griseus]|uniref:Uncharacterized protein n=1 Tax=Cricetulus griseus TaxID=10029 RepID=G3I1A3_CRIGR|nr:hypothetical protein I79_017154 [Cricetulus griseus]